MIIATLLLYAGVAHAQLSLSFNEACGLMISNNSALQSAGYALDAASEERRAARGLRMPQVNLSGTYLYMQRDVDIDLGGSKGVVTSAVGSLINDGVSSGVIPQDVAQFIGAGLAPITNLDWRFTLQNRSTAVVGAELMMPIYMGGRINAANRAAELNIDIRSAELAGVESALLTELVERYYGVILAQAVVAVRGDMKRGIEQHLSDAEAMEQEGLMPHSAILFLRYRLLEAEGEVSEAEYNLTIARRALQTTLNIDEEVWPTDELFSNGVIRSLDYYVDAARELNPIIQGAESISGLAAVDVQLKRAELLPELFAFGGGVVYDYKLSDMVPRWCVGLGASFKLFNGLVKERNYAASRLMSRGVDAQVDDVVADVLLMVEQSYYGVQQAIEAMQTHRSSMVFAQSYYTTIYEGFIEGVSSATELMDAQIALTATKVEWLNAAYEYCKALAKLLEVSGLSYSFNDYRQGGEVIELTNTLYRNEK